VISRKQHMYMYITTITHHQTTKEQKKKDFFFFSPFPNPIYLDHRSEAETLSQPEKKHPHEKYPILKSYHIHLHVARSPSASSLSISRFLRYDLVFCCHSLQTENQKKSPEAISTNESCFFFFFIFLFFFF